MQNFASGINVLPPMGASYLQQLYLSNVYVPFNGRTLISLSLGFTHDVHFRPTASDLFEMLHPCSQMQELALRNMIPPDVTIASNPTVLFPKFDIDDKFDHAIALWSHFKAPPIASYTFILASITPELGPYLNIIEHRIRSAIGLSLEIRLMSAEVYGDGSGSLPMTVTIQSSLLGKPCSAANYLRPGTSKSIRIKFLEDLKAEHDKEILNGVAIVQHIIATFDFATHLERLKLKLSTDYYSGCVEQWHTVLEPLVCLYTFQIDVLHGVDDM
jgi:hypothetical protein